MQVGYEFDAIQYNSMIAGILCQPFKLGIGIKSLKPFHDRLTHLSLDSMA